jgi:hypothetical protein
MSHPYKSLAVTGVALACALALAGCGGDKKKPAAVGSPPPPPSAQPEAAATSAPGSVPLKQAGSGLRRPVTYDDKVSVAITDTRHVRNQAKGPGEITGKSLTIFTLRFSNGTSAPLDLNKVRVVARYGPQKTQASPTSYADLNDFYGTVAPGKTKAASYAFDIPPTGYKAVTIGVDFDARRRTALFAGALRP